MARAETNKTINNFVQGLITEAGPLNFPENASLDEDNMELFRNGSRRRRLGIDFETSFQKFGSLTVASLDTDVVHSELWKAVDGDGNRNFMVVQLGDTLHFFDTAQEPLSSGLKGFTLDLTTFQSIAGNVAEDKIQVSSGKGAAFVTGKKLDPFIIEYDSVADTISTTFSNIQVRDFEGVDDGLPIDQNPATLSSLHKYNLQNQGWIAPIGLPNLVTDYFNSQANYPSNVQQWVLGRDSNDDFDPTILIKQDFGNTPAPNGHYLVDPFILDRSAASGIAGIPSEIATSRPVATAFFAGRVWYAGMTDSGLNSDILYSQILNNRLDNVGNCHQEADPTSDSDSLLVDNDGGVVSIPEVGNILKLFPMESALIVLADNGVWAITGTDGGFKATDFSTDKISGLGILSVEAVIDIEGIPTWWSDTGISTVVSDNVTGKLSTRNLTIDTIQTFYDEEITGIAKRNATGDYDKGSKRAFWLYKADDTGTNSRRYDRILILDVGLGAFYPQSISDLATDSPYIAGIRRTTDLNEVTVQNTVTDVGVTVVDATITVVDGSTALTSGDTFVKFLTIDIDGTSADATFSDFKDLSFHDWVSADGASIGADYSSFLITGHFLEGDVMRFKEANYVYCYFNRTETTYVLNPSTGGYDFDRPSSCFMRVRWDWTDNINSGRFSSSQQVYRLRKNFTPDIADLTFDNGHPVVITKNKVRGKGRALQYEFTSEESKDFHLLGWATNLTGNTKP